MDRRLFLPEKWVDDRDRREQAGVSPGVIFRTKPQLALEMVAAATAEGGTERVRMTPSGAV
jgi:SRSO17 transposase